MMKVFIEPQQPELDRRVFRRMEDGSLEWTHYCDWQADGHNARFYHFASRELPASVANQETGPNPGKFWDWWDRTQKEAAASDDGKAFIAAGFELYANGGGLTAWSKELPNGWQILITDSEGCTHTLGENHVCDEGKPDCWLVGCHGPEGEFTDAVEAATVADAIEAAKVQELARRFADKLKEAFTEEQFAEMCRRNATPEYSEIGACASHDFCDANMVMYEAWLETCGTEPDFLSMDSESPEAEAAMQFWGKAWSLAQREYLTVKESGDGEA